MREDPDFRCKSCTDQDAPQQDEDDTIQIDGERIEEVKEFCYLGDLFGLRGKRGKNGEDEGGCSLAEMA